MATLTVWKFDSPTEVHRAAVTLLSLPKERLVDVHDAASVSWPDDKRQPTADELSQLPAASNLGPFWGLLFGLLFYIPLLGSAIGAAAVELDGALNDVGISDDLLRWVRRQIVAGTSALFVFSSDSLCDTMHAAFAASRPEVIECRLTGTQEHQLRHVFAVD